MCQHHSRQLNARCNFLLSARDRKKCRTLHFQPRFPRHRRLQTYYEDKADDEVARLNLNFWGISTLTIAALCSIDSHGGEGREGERWTSGLLIALSKSFCSYLPILRSSCAPSLIRSKKLANHRTREFSKCSIVVWQIKYRILLLLDIPSTIFFFH